MDAYLARRIKEGFLNYNLTVAKYPQFKSYIDTSLANDGYVVNEDGTVTQTNL